MPEMENLDRFQSLINLVVDAYRCMEKAADVLTLVDCYTEERKQSENLGVGKKTFAEAGCSVRIVNADMSRISPRSLNASWVMMILNATDQCNFELLQGRQRGLP
jgi:hypothetical protein